MASMLQVFDLDNQAVSAGKKVVHERRFNHGQSGLKAPRNSLDIALEAPPDGSRERSMRPEDVPFGYELHKLHLAAVATRSAKDGPVKSMAAQVFSGELESKRRAPSVVAQLMGLDSLPDDLLPLAPRKSCHEPRSYVEASQLPYKENRPFLLRQQSQGSAPASMWPPPLPKNMHRRAFSQDNEAQEPETPIRILPSQDHSGKIQLQQFKEFSAQSGSQSQGPERPRPVQLMYMNQQLEEKKNQVRATLDQARLGLVQGNMSNLNCELTCEEFQKSKEFLDAMNFLQCNKEFFFEFLQQKPNTVFRQRFLEPGSWEPAECLTHLKPLKKPRVKEKSCTEGTERKREAFSPRAFACQFLESLKPHELKFRQAKMVDGNQTKLSAGSHHEASQCNSSSSRSRIMEADLSPSKVAPPKSRLSEIKSGAKDSMPLNMSMKLSRNLADDGRDCVKDSAHQLVEEVNQRAKQWDRDQLRDEMRYATQTQGSSKDSTKVAQDIARQAQEATPCAAADESSRYKVSLSRNALTGERVTIYRKDIEGSNVTTCNKAGDGALTPTLRPLREHVSRPCTSLPNSPRLTQKHDLSVATKKKKTCVIEKAKALLPDHGDADLKLKVGSDAMVAPMLSGVAESKCVGECPKPGSLTHVQTVLNSKSAVPSEIIAAGKNALSKPCRAVATSAINANCQNTAMKLQVGHSHLGSQRLRIEAKESLQREKMPVKCSSTQNTSLPCHEHNHSSDGSRKKPMNSLGPQQKPNQKFVRKALPETTKAASSKNTQSQTVEKRRGLLSVDKKKTCTTVNQPSSANHHTQRHSLSPVVAQVVQLVESSVSQNSVLVDADCVNNRGSQAKLCNPSVEANRAKASATGTPLQRPSTSDKSTSADTHAGACVCEQESLDDMRRVMSQSLCQVDGGELATAECGHVTTPVTLREVEPRKQSRTLRPWSMACDIVDRVNEGADLTFDKHEQPSPISVLESPFEEESPSPPEFKEITNNLRELRIQLNLSKVDGIDRLKLDMENVPPEDHEFAESLSGRVQSQINSSTPLVPSLQESKTRSQETTKLNLIDNFLPKSLLAFESLGMRKSLCSSRWEDDLTYICNVLHSSGFVDETGSILSTQHSLTCPLGQLIFKRLEACYPSSKSGSSNRQVLFDAINEILFRNSAPWNLQPWLALKASPPTIGKKIAEEIWLEICNQRFDLRHKELHDDYLESLVAQDMMNSGMWIYLHQDMDNISVELEHTIFNELVEEVIQNLIS